MRKIIEAEILSANKSQLQITLSTGDVIIGHSVGIEPAFDADGEELDYDVLVFDSLIPPAYFRLKDSDIKSVKKFTSVCQ